MVDIIKALTAQNIVLAQYGWKIVSDNSNEAGELVEIKDD